MNVPRTVFLLTTNYGKGGAQRVFYQQASGFSKNFRVIEIVFNNDWPDVYGSCGEKISLEVPAGNNLFLKAYYFLLRCYRLHKLKSQYRPICTISHLEGANFVNVLSMGFGKTYLCVHGSKTAFDVKRKGIIKFIENQILTKVLYRFCDKIFPVSFGIAHELISVFKIPSKKIFPIQNCIDFNNIQQFIQEPVPQYHSLIFESPVICFIGRLAQEKNLLGLLELYWNIRKTAFFNLLVIGDGPELEKLERRSRELGLSFNINVKGEGFPKFENSSEGNVFVLPWEINPFKYISHSSIFILPSNTEGFPLALCEALACKVLVMATDCPTGSREILNPESEIKYMGYQDFPEVAPYGILFPVISESPDQRDYIIKNAVRGLSDVLNNQALLYQIIENGYMRAQELDIAKYLNKWETIINSDE